MDNREFCQRMIAEWEAKSREAGEKQTWRLLSLPNAKSKIIGKC